MIKLIHIIIGIIIDIKYNSLYYYIEKYLILHNNINNIIKYIYTI
jgi:hypothetical protein